MIEAAGWRTSAPKGRAARRARAPRKSFGVEARQPFRGDGLHFYVGPSNGSRRFYWIFPAGDHVRAGLATYTGHSALSQDLVDFLGRHELGDPGHQHGGFFTSRLIDPIRDGMFVVGDAAGQCLPVSGEGIRPAWCSASSPGAWPSACGSASCRSTRPCRGTGPTSSRGRAATASSTASRSILNVLPDPLFAAFARTIASDRGAALGDLPLLEGGRPRPAHAGRRRPSRSRWWRRRSDRRRGWTGCRARWPCWPRRGSRGSARARAGFRPSRRPGRLAPRPGRWAGAPRRSARARSRSPPGPAPAARGWPSRSRGSAGGGCRRSALGSSSAPCAVTSGRSDARSDREPETSGGTLRGNGGNPSPNPAS